MPRVGDADVATTASMGSGDAGAAAAGAAAAGSGFAATYTTAVAWRRSLAAAARREPRRPSRDHLNEKVANLQFAVLYFNKIFTLND